MNTFRDIANDELSRAQERGEWITNRDANIRAANRILEGFRTLEEAGEYTRVRDGMSICDVFGYPIAANAIEWAIWIKLSPEVIKFKIGDSVDHNGVEGSVQYWGMPGKRGMRRCSRKQAIKSGSPQVYLWFHNKDYTEESWEWASVLEVTRW